MRTWTDTLQNTTDTLQNTTDTLQNTLALFQVLSSVSRDADKCRIFPNGSFEEVRDKKEGGVGDGGGDERASKRPKVEAHVVVGHEWGGMGGVAGKAQSRGIGGLSMLADMADVGGGLGASAAWAFAGNSLNLDVPDWGELESNLLINGEESVLAGGDWGSGMIEPINGGSMLMSAGAWGGAGAVQGGGVEGMGAAGGGAEEARPSAPAQVSSEVVIIIDD